MARPNSTYHPPLWRDDFLTPKDGMDGEIVSQQHEELKREARKMLMDGSVVEKEKLMVIDAFQRLGVSYHFESEIEVQLHNMSLNIPPSIDSSDDLYSVALWFRLLRQQGFHISPEVFNKFKDGEGKFKESMLCDVMGMLSLYEASFLGIQGEDILDQALAFTTENFGSMMPKMSDEMAEEVSFAMFRPIRKRLQRVEARHFIHSYRKNESHNSKLLRFAELDFNILQRQHQEQLHDIHVWWTSLDVPTNFEFARDRIVECYFWISGVYFEPMYALGRRLVTKFIAILSLTDDTYDNFATYKQLNVFTEAIKRWDVELISGLPKCMKMLYGLYVYIFNEIEEAVSEDGRSFAIAYAKEALDATLNGYLTEAKWRDEEYRPTLEEYMQVSLVTSCYPLLATMSFVGMPQAGTKEAFDWISGGPAIMKASSIVCRLMDDIVSHEFEQERKHIPSAVELYKEKYKVSEEVVVKVFNEQITNAWKDINKELLRPWVVAPPLLDRILNFTRAMDIIYKVNDGYSDSYTLKDYVVSVLKEPVVLSI
ncbi:Alpha-copaene synthase [Linum grandiflorum]